MTPELLVVAVTRDRPLAMLWRWLDSLAGQTVTERIAVCLVSYGSTLFTAERELCAVYDGVTRVTALWVGRNTYTFRQGRGLNIGLRHAMNRDIPYVMFCNVDGVYAPGFCSEVLRVLQEDGNAVALCRRRDEQQDGTVDSELRSEAYLGDCIALATAKAADLGGFDEHYTNWGDVDLDFVQRCTDNGMTKKWLHDKTNLLHQWHQPSPFMGQGHGAYREAMRSVLVRNQGQEWGQL